MKKLFTFMVLLVAGAILSTVSAASYNLQVLGVQVTDDNKSDIKPTGLKSGSIKFDGNKTLTCTNVSVDATKCFIHNTGITDLKIIFVGSNTVKTTDSGIVCDVETYVQGNIHEGASLSITCGDVYACIWTKAQTLHLWNLSLTATGKKFSIYGYDNSQYGKLAMSCMEIHASTDDTNTMGAIGGFSSFSQNSAYLYSGSFNADKHGICDGSGNLLKTVTNYADLKVDNCIVYVTGGGNYTLHPSAMTAGSATYNADSKTLTLNGVTMKTPGNRECIYNRNLDGLTINVKGNNKLELSNTSSGSAIKSRKPITIAGTSSDDDVLNCSAYVAFYLEAGSGPLTFKDIGVLANGGNYGLVGNSQRPGLVMERVVMIAVGSETAAIAQFGSCTMTGCDVSSDVCPGVCFRKSLGGFGTTDALLKDGSVWILKPTKTYPVYVLGRQVNDINNTNVALDGLTAGKISYDEATQKLTIDNVTMVAPSDNSSEGIKISGGSDGYVINLVGTNEITSAGDALYITRDTEFNGNGNCKFVSTVESGLSCAAGACITLNTGDYIRFVGKKYGYWGTGSSNEVLTVKKPNTSGVYRFKGDIKSVHNLTALALDNTDFWSPETANENLRGCYFNEETKDVRQNGGSVVKDWVAIGAISKKYGIFVGDKEINDRNAAGVGSKYITAGGAEAVTYNKNTNTLTLDGATITNKGDDINAVKNAVSGLTINVTGDNTLITERSGWNSDNTSINLQENTTITGSGSLSVKGIGPLYIANGKKLTFKDAKKVYSESSIRSNNSSSTAQLVVDNSNVETDGSVCFFGSVTWVNGYLAVPTNGRFDTASSYIVDANGDKATRVVFLDKNGAGIEGVELDNNADVKDVYDASGRQVEGAHKGLNIVRMSDGTVRKVMVK